MSKEFLFSDYWAAPEPGYLHETMAFNPADQKDIGWITWYTGEGRVFRQEDYHGGEWDATWVNDYNFKDSMGNFLGIMELEDIYPRQSYQFWTKFRTTAFTDGHAIPWGGLQKIGDVIDKPLKISALKSTFFTFPSPGRQVVKFIAKYDEYTNALGVTYKDVLEVTYDQTFGDKTAGARSWYARNYGIIETRWRYNGADVGDKLGMKLRIGNGYIDKNKYPVWT